MFPLLSTLALLFFEVEIPFTWGDVFLSVLPMASYGLWYIYRVVLTKQMRDIYGFTREGHWQLVFALMLAATFLMGALLRWLHNRLVMRMAKQG